MSDVKSPPPAPEQTAAATYDVEKVVNELNVIHGKLLGDYDENGEYVIDKNVIADLVNMPKKIESRDENGVYLVGTFNNRIFHFYLSNPKVTKSNEAFTYLKILESIEYANGYIVDTQTTTLATYSFENDEHFRERTFNVFHITDDTTGDDAAGGGDDALTLYNPDYLKQRTAYLDALETESEEDLEKLEEKYFERRIQLLNEFPEGAIILAEYNKEVAKLQKFFIKDGKGQFRAMNELLTRAIIEKKEVLVNNPDNKVKLHDLDQKYINKAGQIAHAIKTAPAVTAAVTATAAFGIISEAGERKEKPVTPQVDEGVKLTNKEKTGKKERGAEKYSDSPKPTKSESKASQSSAGGKNESEKSTGGAAYSKEDSIGSYRGGAGIVDMMNDTGVSSQDNKTNDYSAAEDKNAADMTTEEKIRDILAAEEALHLGDTPTPPENASADSETKTADGAPTEKTEETREEKKESLEFMCM